MPFKFKLSKRLALMKASLAASTALVLACDLTGPQPRPSPLTQVVTSPGTVTLHEPSVAWGLASAPTTTRQCRVCLQLASVELVGRQARNAHRDNVLRGSGRWARGVPSAGNRSDRAS
jgi:hypothetical protein